MKRLSSLDILLDTSPPQMYDHNFALTPLSPGEAYIAEKGIGNRLSYYFNKDKAELDEDGRLMAVYNFLSNKIDKYRTQAQNIVKALEATDDNSARSYQALAMSSIMVAQEAKRKGWPKKNLIQPAQELKYREALALSQEDFSVGRAYAARAAVENGRYWVYHLEKSRGHYVIPKFREAIAESIIVEEAAV